MSRMPDIRRAAGGAIEAGDAQGLRTLLSTPEGDTIDRDWITFPATAAAKGDTQCLRVLAEFGFTLTTTVWEFAARHGHVNCLEFAVSGGYTLKDSVLGRAVCKGQLACVDFLLQQGLPHEPYLHSMFRTHPAQHEFLQLMLDKGVAINPQTLILAASRGDVDFVRWLHQRGVPLWRDAQDARYKSREFVLGYRWVLDDRVVNQWRTVEGEAEPPGTIAIPWEMRERETAPPWTSASMWDPCDLESTWKALRYGAVFGAPVTRRAERMFAKKRERTHAVLLCFKAATRLCTGPACEEQRRVWAGMAPLPSPLVEELLILADLEIPESVVPRSVPTAPSTAT